MYYLNSRYYDPQIGRFINADDIGVLRATSVVQNGINLDSYCVNNPIMKIDSLGKLPVQNDLFSQINKEGTYSNLYLEAEIYKKVM